MEVRQQMGAVISAQADSLELAAQADNVMPQDRERMLFTAKTMRAIFGEVTQQYDGIRSSPSLMTIARQSMDTTSDDIVRKQSAQMVNGIKALGAPADGTWSAASIVGSALGDGRYRTSVPIIPDTPPVPVNNLIIGANTVAVDENALQTSEKESVSQ